MNRIQKMNNYLKKRRQLSLKSNLNKSQSKNRSKNQRKKSRRNKNAHPQISSMMRLTGVSLLTRVRHSPTYLSPTAIVASTSLSIVFQTLVTARVSWLLTVAVPRVQTAKSRLKVLVQWSAQTTITTTAGCASQLLALSTTARPFLAETAPKRNAPMGFVWTKQDLFASKSSLMRMCPCTCTRSLSAKGSTWVGNPQNSMKDLKPMGAKMVMSRRCR
jgi:hypothetical protein